MGSQRSQTGRTEVQDLLIEAAQWTDEETREKLPAALPVVIDFLKRSPAADDGVQVARFVFGSFLPQLEVDQDAFRLFACTFPALQNFFNTFLEKCVINDENDAEIVNQTLQQCVLVIECCVLAVQFLTQAESVCIEKIESIPRAVLHILNGSLQHCTNSKDKYGDCLELVSNSIAELCHQTVDLGSKFANFASKVTFDTFCDDDLEVLIYMCEQLCSAASLLSQLSDLRAFVTVWRVYASVVCQHHSALITSLETRIPLEALVKEIKNGFQMLVDLPYEDEKSTEKTQKIMQRTIKTINFCLKIVVSLCEKFRGYLRGAHSAVASLLLLLFRFSPGNITLQKFPDRLKKEVESQTTIGIEPLLLHLRNDEDFIKVIFEDKKELLDEMAQDWGSYLLLLVTVAVPPSATVMVHIKKLFSTIFATMHKSHVSLSLPCMMDGVMCGGRQQSKVSLYEHVLTHTCVLVANLDGEQFTVLEEILIEWLLSGQTWPALLAADMWCFIARYGTSDLCWSHCLVLLDVLPNTAGHSHQRLVTSSLLSRLIPKLAPKDKEKFFSLLKGKRAAGDMDTSELIRMLQTEEGSELKELKCDILKSSTKNISAILSKRATEKNLLSLKHDLESLPQTSSTTASSAITDTSQRIAEKEFADTLTKLWNRMPENLIGASAVDQMISSMVHASVLVLEHFSNAQLHQILSLCSRCASRGTSIIGLAISSLIAALGHISVRSSPEEDSVLQLISECLSVLLKSSNPLVHQCALDAFVTFGQHTLHETVLPMCLGECDTDLQEKVTNYLKQEPHPAPTGHSKLSILQLQVNDVMDSTDVCNTYITINDVIARDQTVAGSTSNETLNQDERGYKRKRLDETSTSGSKEIFSFMKTLQESQRLLSELNTCNVLVGDEDRSKIRKCLQEMLHSLDKK